MRRTILSALLAVTLVGSAAYAADPKPAAAPDYQAMARVLQQQRDVLLRKSADLEAETVLQQQKAMQREEEWKAYSKPLWDIPAKPKPAKRVTK